VSGQSVQTVLFPDVITNPLVAQFATPSLSSAGGAILLKAIDDRLALTAYSAGPSRPPTGVVPAF